MGTTIRAITKTACNTTLTHKPVVERPGGRALNRESSNRIDMCRTELNAETCCSSGGCCSRSFSASKVPPRSGVATSEAPTMTARGAPARGTTSVASADHRCLRARFWCGWWHVASNCWNPWQCWQRCECRCRGFRNPTAQVTRLQSSCSHTVAQRRHQGADALASIFHDLRILNELQWGRPCSTRAHVTPGERCPACSAENVEPHASRCRAWLRPRDSVIARARSDSPMLRQLPSKVDLQ